jgi:porin
MAALAACGTAAILSTAAPAETAERAPALQAGITYTGDVMGVLAGRGKRDVAYLDKADVTLSADLEQVIGWRGATAFVDLLNNLGGRPNDTAGTLQGVNNIEVGNARASLYQAWLQQDFDGGRVTVLAGRYDINSEFYYNDAAGQLIGPAFGMGSELASTGPNGPSTFPQTELAVRVRRAGERDYVQVAVVRAPRGTIGTGSRRTALFIAEAGRRGPTALSVGAWSYSRRQPEVVPPGVSIGAKFARSQGAYLLAEQDILGAAGRPGHWRAFLRAGVADGDTTPFGGGLQMGLAGRGVIRSRPDSAASIGYGRADLSRRYRRANPPGEPALTTAENVVELTFSDRLLPFLTLQPDFQYVFGPSGLRNASDVVVLGLRAIIDWKTP